MAEPPRTMFGFLLLPMAVQVVLIFAAFAAFVYFVESEQYVAAGVIVGLFIYYFAVRHAATSTARHRTINRGRVEHTVANRPPHSHMGKMIAKFGWPLLTIGTGTAYLSAEFYAGGLTPLSFLIITSVAVVVSMAFELLAPYRAEWSPWGDRSFLRDLGHTATSTFLGERLGLLLATPFFAWLGYSLAPGDAAWIGIWPTTWPLAAQLALAVFLAEGLDYWRHRLEHEVPFLWPLHFVHHSADRLNTIKSSRNNVADMAARFLFSYVPLLLAGAPPEFILWHGAAVTMFGIAAHSNSDFRIPAFMHRWVVTPQVHRIHHMADPVKGNSNYANITPVYDRLFGTFVMPTPADRHQPVGVFDNPLPTNFVAEGFAPLLWPFYRRHKQPETVEDRS